MTWNALAIVSIPIGDIHSCNSRIRVACWDVGFFPGTSQDHRRWSHNALLQKPTFLIIIAGNFGICMICWNVGFHIRRRRTTGGGPTTCWRKLTFPYARLIGVIRRFVWLAGMWPAHPHTHPPERPTRLSTHPLVSVASLAQGCISQQATRQRR